MTAIGRRQVLIGGAATMFSARAARGAAVAAPPPIANQGFRLVFADDFDTLDVGETGRRWTPHLWYEHPADADQYAAANSVLTLRCVRHGRAWADCNLTTEWADTRGGTFFRGGYFEARMKLPRGWPSFWLFSVDHTRGMRKRADAPASLCAEIDVMEGDSAHPTATCGAVHRNTGGQGGIPDEFNHNNCHEIGVDLTQGWHDYAVRWTRETIIWYVDQRESHRAPAFDSTWQSCFLILGLAAGGVLNGPPPGPGIDAIELLVDHVRVWDDQAS